MDNQSGADPQNWNFLPQKPKTAEDRHDHAQSNQRRADRLDEVPVEAHQAADGAALLTAAVTGFIDHKKAGKEQRKADQRGHQDDNSAKLD